MLLAIIKLYIYSKLTKTSMKGYETAQIYQCMLLYLSLIDAFPKEPLALDYLFYINKNR